MQNIVGLKYKKGTTRCEILSKEGSDTYKVIFYDECDYKIRYLHTIDLVMFTQGWERV